jgi:hypothetical protein
MEIDIRLSEYGKLMRYAKDYQDIVRELAEMNVDGMNWVCPFCQCVIDDAGPPYHRPDCIWLRAKKLMEE